MMVGVWGTTTLIPVWIQQLVEQDERVAGIDATGKAFMLANLGAVCGFVFVAWLADALGRRGAYAFVVAGCIGTSVFAFSQIETIDALVRFMPLYGFFAIGGFGSVAAYLPELFPTRIRATGQGLCWNAGRVVTAAGPLVSGMLVENVGSVPRAALLVSASYLVGLVAIWFGPETKGLALQD
jgi:MFS family permease